MMLQASIHVNTSFMKYKLEAFTQYFSAEGPANKSEYIYEAKESSRSGFQYRVALRGHVRSYGRGVWRINPGSQYWSYWSQFI